MSNAQIRNLRILKEYERLNRLRVSHECVPKDENTDSSTKFVGLVPDEISAAYANDLKTKLAEQKWKLTSEFNRKR